MFGLVFPDRMATTLVINDEPSTIAMAILVRMFLWGGVALPQKRLRPNEGGYGYSIENLLGLNMIHLGFCSAI